MALPGHEDVPGWARPKSAIAGTRAGFKLKQTSDQSLPSVAET